MSRQSPQTPRMSYRSTYTSRVGAALTNALCRSIETSSTVRTAGSHTSRFRLLYVCWNKSSIWFRSVGVMASITPSCCTWTDAVKIEISAKQSALGPGTLVTGPMSPRRIDSLDVGPSRCKTRDRMSAMSARTLLASSWLERIKARKVVPMMNAAMRTRRHPREGSMLFMELSRVFAPCACID